jgi:hypothetical protein
MRINELNFNKSEFNSAVKECNSIRELCKWFNKPVNGYYAKLFNKWILKFECDTKHFYLNKAGKKLKLFCENPKCKKLFLVNVVDKDRKFCSLLCANQKVRGRALPRPDEELICQNKHKVICFRYHKKECCICGIKNPVTVHHYNENHIDDRPENLVPICANHHILLHTKGFMKDIQPKVDDYVKRFIGGKEEQQIRRTVTAETAGAAPVTPATL